jgi:hypothetical protein
MPLSFEGFQVPHVFFKKMQGDRCGPRRDRLAAIGEDWLMPLAVQ